MNDTLIKLLATVPAQFIPKLGTQPYRLLIRLLDGEAHKRGVLDRELQLNGNLRSPLQALEGDPLNWNILNISFEGESQTRLKLDPRHLSGDQRQDAAARLERRIELKKASHKEALQGAKREPRAFCELQEAEKDYFLGLGKAANDSLHGGPHDE